MINMVTNKKAVKISTVTPIKKTIRAKATTIEPLKNKLEEIDEYSSPASYKMIRQEM